MIPLLIWTGCHLFEQPDIPTSCEEAGTCGTTGTGTGTEPTNTAGDLDGDGWSVADGDCDDTDPAVNPGATEECNTDGVDDDCSGTDNDPDALHCLTFYEDADGDGYGQGDGLCLCYPEGDFTSIAASDCDDTRNDRFPGNPEVCGDGIDQDCDEVDAICTFTVTVLAVADLAVAQGIADLLADYGVVSVAALVGDVTTADLADDDVIVLAPEDSPTSWSIADAAVVDDAALPVLGMGLAAFTYFLGVGSPIGQHPVVYDEALAIAYADPGHVVFESPYDISDVAPPVRIVSAELPGYALDIDQGNGKVEYLAVAYADDTLSLLSAAGLDAYWSLTSPAPDLTVTGEQLLLNTITWLASQ